MNTAKKILVFLASAALLFGQSATPINYPQNTANTYQVFEQQTLTIANIAVTPANLIFIAGTINCAGTGTTVTLTDGNSKTYVFVVAANTVFSLSVPLGGVYFSKGFGVTALAAVCTGTFAWRQ